MIFEKVKNVKDIIKETNLPIGTIVMWYNYTGLKLEPGWVICDGRVIDDKLSPLYGLRTPDLVGKFVKGGRSAGDEKETDYVTSEPSETVDIQQGTGETVTVASGSHTHNIEEPSHVTLVFIMKTR